MVYVYNEKDYITTQKQKKSFILTFLITLGVLLIVNVGVFVFYTMQEYRTPLKTPLILFNSVSCCIYAAVYYVLFEIKYKRVSSYARMLDDFQRGIIEEGRHAFVRTEASVTEKDGVRFIPLVFLEWSDKSQDYFERRILFDVEKPVPDFKKGEMVIHKTQGNVLVAYELFDDGIFE